MFQPSIPVLEALTHRALAQWLPEEERELHLRKSLELAREQGRQLEEAASLLMLAHVLKDSDKRGLTWRSGVQILEKYRRNFLAEGDIN